MASSTCSGSSTGARRVRSDRTQVMMAATPAASTAKRAPALTATITTPANAGPTARARLIATLFRATPAARRPGPASSGVSDWNAGTLAAIPAPSENVSSRIDAGVATWASVSAAAVAVDRSIHDCVASSSLRLSTMSVTAPASRASSTAGRLVAVCTSATSVEEPPSVAITVAAPTVFIQTTS
ncbi:MAG TPA: hypothetical protein VH300_07260 [Thermoleophilaceae bacterium]|nr:hypothetical protein [Thermoleophilaceae bacterium]